MSLILYRQFQEHRERRQKKASVLGHLAPLDDARKHHADREHQENVDEPSHGEGTDGSEEPEDDEDQRER